MEFLSKTPVRIALAAVGTVAVATGSYLIGRQHGAQAVVEQCKIEVEKYLTEAFAKNENAN